MSEDYSCRCALIGLLWEYSYRCALIGIPWLAGAGGAGHRERDGVVVLRVPHHGLLLSQSPVIGLWRVDPQHVSRVSRMTMGSWPVRVAPLGESTPKLRESTPKLRESTPKLRESTPKLRGSTPKLRESTPKL
eukprot:9475623-Pyramimonas_sp.AAC.1